MNHGLALYRQWRPGTFAEVIGQEHITRILKNALLRNVVSHAYLFCGPRGTGKTSVARILSRALNCSNTTEGEPCNTCPACMSISDGSSMDVIEIDAASNRGIDEIRDLRDKVKYLPIYLKYKVYIIDEIHMLTTEAFNALLKTLEEPPEHCIFILATTEPYKIPATILSRCQRLSFRRLSLPQITGRLCEVLESNSISFDERAVHIVAKAADGSLRDGLSILEQCIVYGESILSMDVVKSVIGTTSRDVLLALCESVINKDIRRIFECIAEMVHQGYDPKLVFVDAEMVFRDMLALKLAGTKGTLELHSMISREELEQLANSISEKEILDILNGLFVAEAKMRYSVKPRLTIELALLGLCNTQQRETTAATAADTEVEDAKDAKDEKPDDLNNLMVLWSQVFECLKREKQMKTYAFLSEGKPIDVKGDVLIIEFGPQFNFHVEQINNEDNKVIIERALHKVFRTPLKFKTVVKSVQNQSIMENPAVKSALQLLDGEVVQLKESKGE